MRIIFQSRIDLFTRRGGDTVQIEKTAEELRKLGVEVGIDCLANPDLSGYDLVHLFNIDWPAQVYLQVKNAKKQGKSIVFSPIHHSFREIERYEREARYGLRRVVNIVFRKRESRERFKDFCRMLADHKKIPSTLVEFGKGILNEQRELLGMADVILVQTDGEAKDIGTDFGFAGNLPRRSAEEKSQALRSPGPNSSELSSERKTQSLALSLRPLEPDSGESAEFCKVVNGVEARFAEAKPDWFVEEYGLRDFILCVGRIEPRKNQLKVIEAVVKLRSPKSEIRNPCLAGRRAKHEINSNDQNSKRDQGVGYQTVKLSNCQTARLLFVGKVSWRHPEYALRFLNLVRKHDWIHHIPQIPYKKMGSCYATAKVHVLASWFETTGLVSLEAGLAGCNVVASGEQAQEYLGDFAEYCDPGDVDSITAAIRKTWEKPLDPEFKKHILENFTWGKTAEQTLAAYRQVVFSI